MRYGERLAEIDAVPSIGSVSDSDLFNQQRLHGEITYGPGYATPKAFEAAHHRQTTGSTQAGTR